MTRDPRTYNRPIAYLRVRDPSAPPLLARLFFRYLSRVELNVPLKLLTFRQRPLRLATPDTLFETISLLVDGVAEQRSRAGDFAICFPRIPRSMERGRDIWDIFFETVTSIERFRQINGRDFFLFFIFIFFFCNFIFVGSQFVPL